MPNRFLLWRGHQPGQVGTAAEEERRQSLISVDEPEGIATMTVEAPRPALVHPVYLDISMMASFYAAMGLAKQVDRTEKHDTEIVDNKKAESGFEASFAEPLLQLFSLKLRLGGGLDRQKRSEESVEIRSLFQHTEASLFNQLRAQLWKNRDVHGPAAGTDGRELMEGDLVEIAGRVVGNPLEQLVEAYDRLLAYAGVRGDPPRKTRSQPPRLWWWPLLSKRASSLMNGLLDDERNLPKMAQLLHDDLARAEVRDLLVETDSPKLTVVVVVSTEFFTGRSADYLLGGHFRVLGKVMNANYAATPLDFMRRTTLAAMTPARASKLVGQLRRDVKSVGGSDALWASIEGQGLPSLQLLPLAIFV